MVLHDVACRSDTVVISCATCNTNIFRHSYLNIVHIVVVPQGLKHRVCEAHRKNVLHRLFTEVVVNAKNGRRREHSVNESVEFLGRCEIVPERLFDYNPSPGVCRPTFREARSVEVLQNHGEEAWRYGEVERMVSTGPSCGVQVTNHIEQVMIGAWIGEVAVDESDAFSEAIPHLIAESRTGMFGHRLSHNLGEVFMVPLATSESHKRKARWEQSAVCQVVDGRHDLLTRKITSDAKQDE